MPQSVRSGQSRLNGAGLDLRGRFATDSAGHFHFRNIRAAPYPIPIDAPVERLLAALGRAPTRPSHIHVLIEALGHRPLTTHLFSAGDPHLAEDAIFGVKPGLAGPSEDLPDAALGAPRWRLRFDFRLPSAAVVWSSATMAGTPA